MGCFRCPKVKEKVGIKRKVGEVMGGFCKRVKVKKNKEEDNCGERERTTAGKVVKLTMEDKKWIMDLKLSILKKRV